MTPHVFPRPRPQPPGGRRRERPTNAASTSSRPGPEKDRGDENDAAACFPASVRPDRVVVGGTLHTGGVGSLWTTLAGILLLGLIINLLGFENLDPYWQNVIRGAFLLVVVILQRRLSDRRSPLSGR